MAIEQLEKVLVRYDPVRGGSLVQGRLPPTSVHDPSKREQTTLGSSVKSWRRIGAVLNACALQNSHAVSPRENAAVPANDGAYVVQVSAERSDAKAQASFKTLQSRYPHVLGRRSPLIRRVELAWTSMERN